MKTGYCSILLATLLLTSCIGPMKEVDQYLASKLDNLNKNISGESAVVEKFGLVEGLSTKETVQAHGGKPLAKLIGYQGIADLWIYGNAPHPREVGPENSNSLWQLRLLFDVNGILQKYVYTTNRSAWDELYTFIYITEDIETY